MPAQKSPVKKIPRKPIVPKVPKVWLEKIVDFGDHFGTVLVAKPALRRVNRRRSVAKKAPK